MNPQFCRPHFRLVQKKLSSSQRRRYVEKDEVGKKRRHLALRRWLAMLMPLREVVTAWWGRKRLPWWQVGKAVDVAAGGDKAQVTPNVEDVAVGVGVVVAVVVED